MKFNEIYIAAERLQFEEMLMKENLKEMYDYLGYEKFNNYVQNSELNEDFKHKVKNFGKVAALNAALLAGSLGLASCTPPTGNNIIPEDTPIENPVEDDYTDEEEEDTSEEEEASVEEEKAEAPVIEKILPLEGDDHDIESQDYDGVQSDGTYTQGLKFYFTNKTPEELNKVELYGYIGNDEISFQGKGLCNYDSDGDGVILSFANMIETLTNENNGNLSKDYFTLILEKEENSVTKILKIKFYFDNCDPFEFNYSDSSIKATYLDY